MWMERSRTDGGNCDNSIEPNDIDGYGTVREVPETKRKRRKLLKRMRVQKQIEKMAYLKRLDAIGHAYFGNQSD